MFLFCGAASENFVVSAWREWNFWESDHVDKEKASRQQLAWQELTRADAEPGSATGLTGGLLKLGPRKELPTHYHPEPFGEIYHFIRGDGNVKLHEFTAQETRHRIFPGLHVNIPAGTLHGIDAGDSGCEFLWMFPASRWADIPYLYIDKQLSDRNVPRDYSRPYPAGVTDWEALWQNISKGRHSQVQRPDL